MTSSPPGGSSEAPGLGRSMKLKPGGDERRIATSADDRCQDSVTTSKSMLFARMVSGTARYFFLNEWMFQVVTRTPSTRGGGGGGSQVEGETAASASFTQRRASAVHHKP